MPYSFPMYQSLIHILHGFINILGEDGTTASGALSGASHFEILLSANSFTRLQPFRNDSVLFSNISLLFNRSLEKFQVGVSKTFGENILLYVG